MKEIKKSRKLDNVCYDIRGPILTEAKRLEEEGYSIIKLNIGNPAPFGFDAPNELLRDMIVNLPNAQGYSDSKGVFPARKAVMQEFQKKGILDVNIDDIYIGNGGSELIVMALQALLNSGDEVLIPAPDYPLWTAAANLSGGKAVHYLCDEKSDWAPDVKDMEKKITSRTKAIVVINPNNPTGAVYPKEILQKIVHMAQKHHLILFADEIYDKVLYDNTEHVPLASLVNDVLVGTFGSISKNYRAAGFRAGWLVLSGKKDNASDYIEGLDILSNMRLCSNVQAQYTIQACLGGYQSIYDLTKAGGRLAVQRDLCWKMLNKIPGVSCVKPLGAFYMFPKIDPKKYPIQDDRQFILELLRAEKLMVVQGTGFNWPKPDHLRIVFLPRVEDIKEALTRFGNFLKSWKS
jgi:alanine-synthesizing transaminase